MVFSVPLAMLLGVVSSAGASIPEGGTAYQHFIALNASRTCIGDEHALPFNNQIRGVNLGGWMVLEPWITPSLFYQFLGGKETTTAFDTYTFCEVLGAKEANRQLKHHWATWVTQEIIEELAASGAVNSLRLPVGDYMYQPYGPYEGCFDGALDYVDRLLDWARANGLSVLFDIHTMKDSQNGFDNSGRATSFQWTSSLNSEFSDSITFAHWPIRAANWMGTFDPDTATYPEIHRENIQHGLSVIQAIVDRYAHHPAVLGLEPLNEPWQFTPIDELKQFYWEGYLIVKRGAPYWKYIMHDSFRLDTSIWGGFMDGCPERALDTHIYQAWRDPDSRIGFYQDACNAKAHLAAMEQAFGPVVVGEWSLATDNCAMWLNGFNDNLPGFPRLPCKYIPCVDQYFGNEANITSFDPNQPLLGPYGTGQSGPIYGLCPVGRDWIAESTNPQTGRDWVRAPPSAPKRFDDTDNVMRHLALKKINAFSNVGHGFYFWNFRTDLPEPDWSYLLALERGWIPRGNLKAEEIVHACDREDAGDYKCVLKERVSKENLKKAVEHIYKSLIDEKPGDEGLAQEEADTLSLEGPDLYEATQGLIQDFFSTHKALGATCDFGGAAMLIEVNRTITDDDNVLPFGDDDEYYPRVIYRGPSTVSLVAIVLGATIAGTIVGFVIAMRNSRSFNRNVRESSWFRPISKSSNNLIRSSLNLPELADYNEIQTILDKEKKQMTRN